MDLDLSNLISIGAIAATVASATWFGLMRGRITQLSEWNDDLNGRVTYLEGERTKDREKAAERDAEIARVKSENQILTSRLTGKVEWLALTDQLEEHHRQALAEWKKTAGVLAQILAAIGSLREGGK